MIVVKIELWPLGLKHARRELGRIVIANDSTGDKSVGNYDAVLTQSKTNRLWKHVRVQNFPRLRKNVYSLLKEVLTEVFEDRTYSYPRLETHLLAVTNEPTKHDSRRAPKPQRPGEVGGTATTGTILPSGDGDGVVPGNGTEPLH